MAYKTYQYISTPTRYSLRGGSVDKPVNGKYVSNNDYTHNESWCSPVKDEYPIGTASSAPPSYGVPPVATYNRLHAKAMEMMRGDKGELLTTIAEWSKSLDMITKRGTQLLRAYKALKRFDLPQVARLLSVNPDAARRIEARTRRVSPRYVMLRPRDLKRKRKSGRDFRGWTKVDLQRPTELWLEYWMGWAPLKGEIYNALDVITRWNQTQNQLRVGMGYSSNTSKVVKYPSYSLYESLDVNGSLGAYGIMVVTNHNYLRAHQLGLTNPLLTAWQVVPFSFIVDWFANVGQVLDSLDPFTGVSLIRGGTGYKGNVQMKFVGNIWKPAPAPIWQTPEYFSHSVGAFTKARRPGPLPIPRLVIGLPKLSLTRAATSISLLTEIFLIKKK